MPIKHALPDDPADDTQLQRIRRVILERGFQFAWIAEQLGVSRQNFTHMLAGRKPVQDDHIEKIAFLVGIPIDEIRVGKSKFYIRDLKLLMSSDKAMDDFFDCPLDDRLRKWLRNSLKTMMDVVNEEKPALVRRHELAETAKRFAKAQKQDKEEFIRDTRSIQRDRAEDRLKDLDESEYGE